MGMDEVVLGTALVIVTMGGGAPLAVEGLDIMVVTGTVGVDVIIGVEVVTGTVGIFTTAGRGG